MSENVFGGYKRTMVFVRSGTYNRKVFIKIYISGSVIMVVVAVTECTIELILNVSEISKNISAY